MNIKRVGVDLAKQVFQVHGVDCQDKAVLRKRLKRDQVLKFFATLPRCLVGMGSLWRFAPLGDGPGNLIPTERPDIRVQSYLKAKSVFCLQNRRSPYTGHL